jgi:hypothetical protein
MEYKLSDIAKRLKQLLSQTFVSSVDRQQIEDCIAFIPATKQEALDRAEVEYDLRMYDAKRHYMRWLNEELRDITIDYHRDIRDIEERYGDTDE